jgi:6-pyruvoyl-tetrahydropterin synthase
MDTQQQNKQRQNNVHPHLFDGRVNIIDTNDDNLEVMMMIYSAHTIVNMVDRFA